MLREIPSAISEMLQRWRPFGTLLTESDRILPRTCGAQSQSELIEEFDVRLY